MTSVEAALDHVAAALGTPAPGTETVDLADALGRVLAEDVPMDHDVPPFRRAAMDGFAVRAADVAEGVELAIVGRVVAGDAPGGAIGAVGSGEAARIMTGAPLPDGAERVVPVEWTVSEGTVVRIERVPGDAAHVIEAGAHLRAGQPVARAGRPLDPGDLAALATAGRARVPVTARPRLNVLGTGSELVTAEATPGPGRIRDSNGPMLLAQGRRAGAVVEAGGIAPDEPDALEAAVQRGLEADVLALSGGVSRGELDLVPDILRRAGVEEVFHRWAVQPGGPLWFGHREGTLVFGLPGNPAASFVGFELLVVPALRALAGRRFRPRRSVWARWAGETGRPTRRRRFRPAHLDTDDGGVLVAHPAPWHGSGDPLAASRMRALAVLPEEGAPAAPAEGLVAAIPLSGWPAPERP